MRITLTKLTDQHHRLAIMRDDGTTDQVELATREFLAHDLLHYCLEIEAGLQHSFWGLVASGRSMTDQAMGGEEVAVTESVVGPLSYIAKGGTDDENFLTIMGTVFQSRDMVVPSWLTLDLLSRIRERFRRLMGKYNALLRGESMELSWA